MRFSVFLRKSHKWLTLVVGVQLVLWTLSGLYMTAVHIDVIHGDHLVRAAPPASLPAEGLLDPATLRDRFDGTKRLHLTMQLGAPVYVVERADGKSLVDARTGDVLSPLGEAYVRRVADGLYAGKGAIVRTQLLTEAPREVRGRPVPLWRVDYAGWNDPALYISAETGELLAKRHDLWRVFDFVWMFHIMDYADRTDVNNPLLRAMTIVAAAATLTGLGLLYYSIRLRRRRA